MRKHMPLLWTSAGDGGRPHYKHGAPEGAFPEPSKSQNILSVRLQFCYIKWIYSHLMKWPILLILAAWFPSASGAELPAAARFRKNARPILEKYCSDCHLDGMNKGGIAFDEFKSDDALLAKHDLWLAVLKNTRAGLMPPAKKPRPSAEERRQLEEWIKFDAFGINPQNPDPGRVTARRLNRTEY